MPVYIPCDKCQKRLKIPENVLGRSIKCPACGSVFTADPEKATPAEAKSAPPPAAPPRPAPVAHDEEEPAAARAAKKVAPLDEDEDAPRPAKKKAVALDDEGAEDVRPAKKKAVVEEDDAEEVRPAKKKPADEDENVQEARPAKKKAAVAEDEDEDEKPARPKKRPADADEEDEEAEKPKKGKRRTPWYVMLPLLILSFAAVPLAWVWTLGFAYAGMDKTMGIEFDTALWIGVASAGGLTLLCLIFSLIPARAWLRFLLVFLLLLLGYGASLGVMVWSDTQQSGKKKASGTQGPGGGDSKWTWTEFASPEGKFSVLLPGTPEKRDQRFKGPGGNTTLHNFVVDLKDDGAYTVGYLDLPAAPKDADAAKKTAEDLARSGAQAVQGATQRGIKDVSIDSHPGKEVDLAVPGQGGMVMRTFVVKQRVYTLVAAGPAAIPVNPNVEKFFSSFKLTAP